MAKNKDDFKNTLLCIFKLSQLVRGISGVAVRSGDLHTLVGDYPGADHRMPVCCNVMKEEMKAGDQILDEPSSGQGANLVIFYKLPR